MDPFLLKPRKPNSINVDLLRNLWNLKLELVSKDQKDLHDYFHTTFFSNNTSYKHPNILFWVKINVIIFCENSGRDKNDTGQENIPKLFYGPPGNCADLSKLGYTLNGYYLVNGSKSSNSIEVVLCRFQLPSRGDNNDSNFSFKVSNKWKKVNNCKCLFIAIDLHDYFHTTFFSKNKW